MKNLRLAFAATAVFIITACSNPEADWQKAELENTEAAYRAFLEEHSEGEWAQKAQAQLDILKDNRDWENAQIADAIEAYNNYLLAHPIGIHMGEARQRITELETDAAWVEAQNAGTKEALEDFLLRYADTPQSDQARARLAELNPSPTPAEPAAPAKKPAARPAPARPATSAPAIPKGNFQVQVGAFSSQSTARSEQQRIEKRFKAMLGSLSVQDPTGADRLYRVKSAPMSEAAARSGCQKLKSAGQDCVVVKR